MIRKIALMVLVLCAWSSAGAVTTHFCRCDGVGASGACVPGSDANAGTDPAAPKLTVSASVTAFTSGNPGDQILYCKGGAWNDFHLEGKSVNDTLANYVANPLIFGSYSSPNFTSTAKPRLNLATTCTAYDDFACTGFHFYSSSGWGTTRWGGYIIRDLHIDGGGGAAITQGVVLNRAVEHVTLDNLTISNVAQFGGCDGSATYGYPSDISLLNIDFSYSLGNGYTSYGCDNLLIDGGTIDHAAYASTDSATKLRDHSLYISGREGGLTGTAKGIIVRNLTITNSNYGANDVTGGATKCGGSVIVGHAEMEDWVFENITIQFDVDSALGPCYGLHMTPANSEDPPERARRFTFRGNKVINVGNIGITAASCEPCIFEDNIVVQENNWEFNGIVVGQTIKLVNPIDNQAVVMRNNSVYQYGASDVSTGIKLGGSGTNHKVSNNLIVFGAGSAAGKYCFGGLLAASAYDVWDNNICANHQGWTSGYATKAAFSAARSGHDTNGVDVATTAGAGLVAVPSSANNWSMQITTSSPAKNAGHTSSKSRLAIDGYPAVDARDIGAYEFGSNP